MEKNFVIVFDSYMKVASASEVIEAIDHSDFANEIDNIYYRVNGKLVECKTVRIYMDIIVECNGTLVAEGKGTDH